MSKEGHKILYLSSDDVDAAGADISLAMECVEQVLVLHEQERVTLPSKLILDMDEKRHGRINAMPAYIEGEEKTCGIKWVAGFPHNPTRYGIPRANALVILNDPEKGLPLCIMDGTRISMLRTGAATGIASRYLARPDSKRLALIGAGVQARSQLEAVCHALPEICEVRVYDTKHEVAEEFVIMCSKAWNNLSVKPTDSPKEAVLDSDIVITATVADEPIVKADWLKPGVLFSHIGSFQEEEEAVILQADKVVVDLWEEVLHRKTFLLSRMFREGKIDQSRIHANLGEIICGARPGREEDTERIFFTPGGLGSYDIALATEIFRRAKGNGLGRYLPQ